MNLQNIIEFAKLQGYDDIAPLGKWRGYDCYEPIFAASDEDCPAATGLPLLILVKDGTIRMSTEEEAFAQMEDMENEQE